MDEKLTLMSPLKFLIHSVQYRRGFHCNRFLPFGKIKKKTTYSTALPLTGLREGTGVSHRQRGCVKPGFLSSNELCIKHPPSRPSIPTHSFPLLLSAPHQ